MKILHLTLKHKWFYMILSGEKKEEYRELKSYWVQRLKGKSYDVIRFRNGYSASSPTMDIELKNISIGKGKKQWGGSDNECYILELGLIINHNNCVEISR